MLSRIVLPSSKAGSALPSITNVKVSFWRVRTRLQRWLISSGQRISVASEVREGTNAPKEDLLLGFLGFKRGLGGRGFDRKLLSAQERLGPNRKNPRSKNLRFATHVKPGPQL